jgi:5-(carboxyamino)imidazole ribonucleotide synthase
VARKAQRTAAFYAAKLAVEGLLAVELFVLADGRMVVNELVPAPHPAFDAADLACETGQHEQLVRAVCDLPLGATDVLAPAACVPVVGVTRAHVLAADLPTGCGVWYHAPEPYAAAPGGASAVGHLVASGDTVHAALARAQGEAARLARLARGAARDDGHAAHVERTCLPGYPWHRRFSVR